jgi:hypothetical protein
VLWKSVEIVIGFRRRRVSREWHAFYMFDSVVQESDGASRTGSSRLADITRQLRKGTQQVFTATDALGLGVEAPGTRMVVHAGMVRRLRDYAQDSGRRGSLRRRGGVCGWCRTAR